MAVDKSVIDAQLAEIGSYDSFGTKKEIKYLPEIMMDGEKIYALTSGMMDGNTWLLVITNERIIMLDKGMLYGLKQLVLPLSHIKSVSHKIGILLGEIRIDTGAEVKEVKNIAKQYIPNIMSILNNLLSKRIGDSKENNASNDNTDDDFLKKLERLTQLKEKGLIDDEEFKLAKTKLLTQ